MIASQGIKYTFSGHDSFQCRQLWLKKGFDFVNREGTSFNDNDAVVALGVGKNMVSSIRYWLRAFNIISSNDQPTPFGQRLLSNDGWDPYLEDPGSLWLLHYQLVKTNLASIYSIIFNELRRERIEFSKEGFVAYLNRKSELDVSLKFSLNTVADDFDVFRKMYLADTDSKRNIEETFSGLLCGLHLLKTFRKEVEIAPDKTELVDYFNIENGLRPSLPPEILLYTILANPAHGESVNILSLENDANSPATVFALSRVGLLDKIDDLTGRYPIVFSDQAGIKEMQFKEPINPFTVLNDYYGTAQL